MELAELAAPLRDFGSVDPLAAWRWLTGDDAAPLLLTALGDLFVIRKSGEVAFLDVCQGTFNTVAPNVPAWETSLTDQSRLAVWFNPDLVAELKRRGLRPQSGQCYSPILPPAVGGSMQPENFECASWQLHPGLLGQTHEKSRRFPDGTPLRRFISESEE